MVLAAGAPAVPADADPTAAPTVDGGSVETIVGPGVCPGPGTPDPASSIVGALAVDAEGTIFVDAGPPALGMVTRVDKSGSPSAIRTAGPSGSSGRLAPDGAGGLLVSSMTHIDHHRARGGIVPLAGDHLARQATPSSGDGGPAGQARFASVVSVASDGAGNVYVADAAGDDAGGVRIRFINRTAATIVLYPGTPSEVTVAPGHIDTIAGGGPRTPQEGESAAASEVLLKGDPPLMAVAAGRLYVSWHDRSLQPATVGVGLVNLGGSPLAAHGAEVPPGSIRTVAGGGPAGFGGDGGPARSARLGRLPGIAADGAGNLYLADAEHHRVRKVDSDGVISTFAGFGPIAQGGYNGNDRFATAARLNEPFGLSVGPDGHLYIADRGNGQVRVVNKDAVINAAPGNGLQRAWVCDEQGKPLPPGTSRPLPVSPVDVAVGEGSDVFFTVAGNAGRNPVVYRREASGRVAPVLGGSKDLQPCPACPAPPIVLPGDARLARPVGAAVGRSGGLYVLDAESGGRLWLANLGAKRLSAHGLAVAPGTAASVATDTLGPNGHGGAVAADGRGNVFIADSQQVRRLDDQGKLTTFVERIDVGRLNGVPLDRSAGRSSCCAVPAGLAVDGAGNPYVSDAFSARVWYFNQTAQPVTAHGQTVAPGAWAVIAGRGERGFEGDGGPALDAKLQQPGPITVDPGGHLYIADSREHTVRRVDPAGRISTVVGRGTPGFNGDGLQAGVTALSSPAAVATDGCGNLLIADAGNLRLRRWNAGRPCAIPASAGATEPAATRWSSVASLVGVGLLLSAVATFGILRHRRRRADDQHRGNQPEAVASTSKPSANLQPDFVAIAKPQCHTPIAGPTDTAPEAPERTMDKETQ